MRALRTVVLIGAMSILTNPALAQDWAAEPAGLRAARGIATQFGTYDSHEIDTVNLYSGTLTLANPISPELPSGGALTMGLTAYYGSQAWDTTPAEFTHLDDPLPLGVDNPGSILLDHPSPEATAGFGWSLHPAGLFEPGSASSVGSGSSNNYYLNVARTTKVSQYWRYISPDGSTHFFLSSLHGEVPEPPDDVLPPTPCRSTVQNATPCYTRDCFYLRLRWASSNAVEIEMPNGVVHRLARKPNGSSWGANTFNRDELALTNRGDEHPKRPPRHRPSRSTQATQLLGPQPRGWLRIPRKGVAASLAAC